MADEEQGNLVPGSTTIKPPSSTEAWRCRLYEWQSCFRFFVVPMLPLFVLLAIFLLIVLLLPHPPDPAGYSLFLAPITPSFCASFMLNAAADSIKSWTLPSYCEHFVLQYVEKGQYAMDFALAADSAREYFILKSVEQESSGPLSATVNSELHSQQDPWSEGTAAAAFRANGILRGARGGGKRSLLVVFDIDETSLSNQAYYKKHKYGAEGFDPVSWRQWVLQAAAPPFPPAVKLYQALQSKDINWNVAFVTGRTEDQRNATEKNLKDAGYSGWAALMMRPSPPSDLPLGAVYEEESAVVFKSRCRQQLEAAGYVVRGSIGDQWSDITGPASGNGTFKLPNPFYFVA